MIRAQVEQVPHPTSGSTGQLIAAAMAVDAVPLPEPLGPSSNHA
jgi:hypothetical protein